MTNNNGVLIYSVECFQTYLNSFYGENGLYSSGKDITPEETEYAIESIIEDHGHFEGDSVDRERARDILFTEEEIEHMYKKDYDA